MTNRTIAGLLLAGLVLLPVVLVGSAKLPLLAQESTETDAVSLPMTFPRIWLRPGKRKGQPKPSLRRVSGPLTITDTTLEISGKENFVEIPVASISMVSMGRMGRDVDTDWVLLALDGADGRRVVGLRDGRKMGYGQGTQELFDALRNVMKHLGAAQYRVPDGFRAFDRLDFQFALALPEGWHHFVHSAVMIDNRMRQGTIIFSAERIERGDDNDAILQRVLAGRLDAFYLDRVAAGDGKACDGLNARQRERLIERGQVELTVGGYTVAEAPVAGADVFGDCPGLRVQGVAKNLAGDEKRVDLRAVSDGETLFVFGLHHPAAGETERSRLFDAVIDSVKFAFSI